MTTPEDGLREALDEAIDMVIIEDGQMRLPVVLWNALVRAALRSTPAAPQPADPVRCMCGEIHHHTRALGEGVEPE